MVDATSTLSLYLSVINLSFFLDRLMHDSFYCTLPIKVLIVENPLDRKRFFASLYIKFSLKIPVETNAITQGIEPINLLISKYTHNKWDPAEGIPILWLPF